MGLQKVIQKNKKQSSVRARSLGDANIRAVKTRIGCRTTEETKWPTKWLEINDKGKVGTSDHRAGENTIFYLVPVGMREVAIQHVASGRYVAINSKGKLFSREVYDPECIFKEGIYDNYWTTYSSLKWGIDQMLQSCTWHMGINCRGHRINAHNTRKNKPACHFIPYPIEITYLHDPATTEISGLNSRQDSITAASLV